MPTTPWPAIVKRCVDSNPANAAYFNSLLDVHTRRSEHLYQRIAELESKTVLVAQDIPVLDPLIQSYSTVTYKKDGTSLGIDYAKLAIDPTAFNDFYKLANTSYVFGIVKDIQGTIGNPGNTATVWTHGLIEAKDQNGDPYDMVQWLLAEQDDSFTNGPLFLSYASGKLTPKPSGLVVFVCYVIDRSRVYLAPKTDSHSDFFFNFQAGVIDRPAGDPVYDEENEVWEINNANLTVAGWVPAAGMDGLPAGDYTGSVFKLNLLSEAAITADTTLSEVEKQDLKTLYRTFPTRPDRFNLLTVNGVVQPKVRAAADGGIYHINEYGLWWYGNADTKQPWSGDLSYGTALLLNVTNTATSEFELQLNSVPVNHPFTGGELLLVKANTPSALPTGMVAGTTYQVSLVSGQPGKFLLKRPAAGNTWEIIPSLGAGLARIGFTYKLWKLWKGSANLRPRMDIQYVQINPEYRSSIVTSLRVSDTSTNNSTNTLKLIKDDGSEGTYGELTAKFTLVKNETTETTSTGTCVKQVNYNEQTGKLDVVKGDCVSGLVGLGRVKVYPQEATGVLELAIDDSDLGGLVTSVEVEQARLEYKGLHSYIRMDYTTLPAGFIGKFLLPAALPKNKDLKLKLLAFAGDNTESGRRNVKLQMTYSVSSPSSTALSTAVLPSSVTPFLVTLPYTGNEAKDKPFEITHDSLVIPYTSLVPNGIVNFRLQVLSQTADVGAASAYNKQFCIVSSRWLIEL